jgi:hypothetical protein
VASQFLSRFQNPFTDGMVTIARNKNQNTFAKRQREQDKRRKSEDKMKRRSERKAEAANPQTEGHASGELPPSVPRDEPA